MKLTRSVSVISNALLPKPTHHEGFLGGLWRRGSPGLACCVLVIPLLGACTAHTVALAPVGPAPTARTLTNDGKGELQVYTQPDEYWDDDLSYFPHTDYELYTAGGKRLRRVWNHLDHEDENPAVVSLQPGVYEVKAWADGYGLVSVPVVIQTGYKTVVVLQPGWKPNASVPASELVRIPDGYFVGWRAVLPGMLRHSKSVREPASPPGLMPPDSTSGNPS